jgi:hypothetical protein
VPILAEVEPRIPKTPYVEAFRFLWAFGWKRFRSGKFWRVCRTQGSDSK